MELRPSFVILFVLLITALVGPEVQAKPFDLINVALDDPMLNQIYDFTERMLVKHDFDHFHQHSRPYPIGQLLSMLQFLDEQDLSPIEQQKVVSYIEYFTNSKETILGYRTKSYQFNLNMESGLFSTQRSSSINVINQSEYAGQIRPIVTGQINDSLMFLTDLRFFIVTGDNLTDTIRTEVEADQLNETSFDTAGLSPSYLQLKLSWFNFLIGKQNLSWGPGRYGNLLLSSYAMPMEMIHLTGNYDKVFFQVFHSIAQSPHGNKILSGHRIELNLFSQLRMGIAEIIVIGANKFDPRFLNPVNIYTVSEPSGGGVFNRDVKTSSGNLLISGDVDLKISDNTKVYSELMIDDFQPRYRLKSHLHWGSKWGIILGLYTVNPFKLKETDFRIEYTFLNQYNYTHRIPVNIYTHLERPIGHHLGPDAQSIWAEIQHYWSPFLSTKFALELQHQGEQSINEFRDDLRPLDEQWEYLSGMEEIKQNLVIKGRFEKYGLFFVEGIYKLTKVNNFEHRFNVQAMKHEVCITSVYRF